MNAIPEQVELDPLEIDSPCSLCGLLIDRHQRVDGDEGAICPDDLETQIHLAAADLVRQWELADPRDRWRHTGKQPPKASDIPNARPEPYRPAASTEAAFRYLVATGDVGRLKAWLGECVRHPSLPGCDVPGLIWRGVAPIGAPCVAYGGFCAGLGVVVGIPTSIDAMRLPHLCHRGRYVGCGNCLAVAAGVIGLGTGGKLAVTYVGK